MGSSILIASMLYTCFCIRTIRIACNIHKSFLISALLLYFSFLVVDTVLPQTYSYYNSAVLLFFAAFVIRWMMIIAAALICIDILLIPFLKTEYEYIFCDGQLDFDRINGGARRIPLPVMLFINEKYYRQQARCACQF